MAEQQNDGMSPLSHERSLTESQYGVTAPDRAPIGWFNDGLCSGSWNMALDEALLKRATEHGISTLRFYGWREATLSLGYFQRYAERAAHTASRYCAVVRRATGGGAILHDRELTYSIALPSNHRLSRRPANLYTAVHQSIVDVLASFGAHARLLRNAAASSGAFLCFARRCEGDVILGDWKIAGSAQRRHKGAVLQHGSILFARSEFAPEVPGICDIIDRRIEMDEFVQRLICAIQSSGGFALFAEQPDEALKREAAAIEASKFSHERWLRLR